MFRSLYASTVACALLAACEPGIPNFTPSTVVTAVFDPTTGQIPLPNDLAFFNPPNSVCPPPANTLPATAPPACAQAELLATFAGFFPSDQAVPITIDFSETQFSNGMTTQIAPSLNLASFTPQTFFVWGTTAAGSGMIPTDPLVPADYVTFADHGTLTIHHAGNLPWATGSYSVFVRGGVEGITTTDGLLVSPSPTFALVEQGLDMTDPANEGLLKAQTGSFAAAMVAGAQLNMIIALYNMAAFPIVNMVFPQQELAILATFQIGPTVTNVEIDPARNLAPLPIDLLRDPTTGLITTQAACVFAGSMLAPDGTCPSPAAAGFEALDGFSTTGAMLAPTSDLIEANTVTPSTVLLYDLTDPLNPVLVTPSTLIFEPCEFTSGCGAPFPLSSAIALQPAGATAGDPTSVFRTRPLKDLTNYAVVITTGIDDKAGNPIGPDTVTKILEFMNPLVVGGQSALQGIDNTTALALEKMRLQLQPVFTTAAAAGIPESSIAAAYTFGTQTILSQAVQLAALPYTLPDATALPLASTLVVETPLAAFQKYGVDTVLVPRAHIHEVLEVDIDTLNAINPATGAFLTDPTQGTLEQIHVLITTPIPGNAKIPACAGALAPFGQCAPMMVFRHGLGGGRADMLTVADSYAAAGMVTVAIDAELHGDRAFCTSGSTTQCVGGATCTTTLPPGAQGDTNPPGTCGVAGFITAPVSPTCVGACAALATDGIPIVSGNYLVSTNFFRTRDSLRQDLIDEAQLIRVMGFVPTGAPPTGQAVFDHMAVQGVIIDPATTFFSGQSLGAIQGAMDVATDPRISKAGFNVGGGTIVDIFTNSPAFVGETDMLLASLGILPGTPAYLQFLVIAKMVLDPADPLNFVGHLTANTLPNLLPPLGGNTNGTVPQAPKEVMTQIANCDQTVPNPWNLLYASNTPTGPLPTGPSFFAPGATGTFTLFVKTPFDPTTFGTCSPLPSSAVEHSFLTDWANPTITSTAQSDIANFVMLNTLPLSIEE